MLVGFGGWSARSTDCATHFLQVFLPTFPPPTSFLPFRTRNPAVPLPIFQKSPPLPSTHSSIPPTTFTALLLTLHTSKKTQTVHESSLYTQLVPRTLMFMKPPSHQNPTSMTTTTLSSLPQTMPPCLLGAVLRPFRVFMAWDGTAWTRTFQIIHLPEFSLICRPSSRRKKITIQELIVWRCPKVWSFNVDLFYYPNRLLTQDPCHRTLTLIALSLKAHTVVKILQLGRLPCNGIIP